MNQKNIESIYPLSPAQHGMFVHTSTARGKGLYFERACWTLIGDLSIPLLKEAWQKVIDRHPVLRTFVWQRGRDPVQVVLKQVAIPWKEIDWQALGDNQQQEQLADFLKSDIEADFDMSKAPLMRFALIRLAERKFTFIWSFHHLILDGWSDALLLKEVADLYQGLLQGREVSLTSRRPYQDYVKWLSQQDLSRAEGFFRSNLKGFEAPTQLPLDQGLRPLVAEDTLISKECVDLPEDLARRVRDFAKQQRLTLNTIFQGAWAILLSRYSGQDDVLFGATVYGRPADLTGSNEMIGMFLNALPFRIQVSPDEPVFLWLKRVQSQFADLREFDSVPLVQTQGWSEVPRRVSLFDSLLVFQNTPDVDLSAIFGSAVEASQVLTYDATHHPIEIVVEPGPRLRLRITYDKSHFKKATILWILGHFQTLLEAMLKSPDRPIYALSIIAKSEKAVARYPCDSKAEETFTQFNREDINQSLTSRFEQLVEKYPTNIAVSTSSERCTYRELDRRANRIGNAIVARGLGKRQRVALLLEHGTGMIAALLGTLKAGVAYVPLEAHYPGERLDDILIDSTPSAIVTDRANSDMAQALLRPGMLLIVLESSFEQETDGAVRANPLPEDLAYILYTSGSTGKPKGVIQNHRNVLHFISAYTNALHLVPQDRLTLLSSYSHDAAIVDIFATLLNGATLYPKNIRQDGLLDLATWIAEREITVYHSVPTLFRNLTETLHGTKIFPHLRAIVLGGEAVVPSDVERFRKHFASHSCMVNLYGSTESTISSLHFIGARTTPDGNPVPIGSGIEETDLLLVDNGGRPTDAYGELVVRSPYLALGYWQSERLTRETFLSDANHHGRSVYRTGDIARLRPDGDYEFVCRKDYQVKIRGFRVELGEIEAVLDCHPVVEKAVVVARPFGNAADVAVAAYVLVKHEASVDWAELREHLEKRLPDYMIPAFFVRLNALPLTPSGKIDRRALPEPDCQTLVDQFEPPRNAVEEVVAGVWSEILGRGPIGAYDNFFGLGGHSLLATQVLSRLREHLQVEVPLGRLFESPTVASFAGALLQDPTTQERIAKRAEMIVKIARLSTEELDAMVHQKTLSKTDTRAPKEE